MAGSGSTRGTLVTASLTGDTVSPVPPSTSAMGAMADVYFERQRMTPVTTDMLADRAFAAKFQAKFSQEVGGRVSPLGPMMRGSDGKPMQTGIWMDRDGKLFGASDVPAG